jgi:hypothetical protein
MAACRGAAGRRTDEASPGEASQAERQLKARKIIDRAAKHDTIFVPLREHLPAGTAIDFVKIARE